MSHPEHHGEEHAVKTALPYFPAEEWDHFHQEDIHAAKMIILLMTTIFSIGLVLYATIAMISLGGNRHEEEVKRQNGQSSRAIVSRA